VLGAAPHPHWRREQRGPPSRSPQSRTQPKADAHTFASLRSLQPRVLPFVLSRAALLTRPRPAQPLLLTADSAGSSVFLSPIGVTIAAARPCLFIECVSARTRVRLVPGSMPAHADPCGDNVSFTGREELILRCATSADLPLTAYSAYSEHITDLVVSFHTHMVLNVRC